MPKYPFEILGRNIDGNPFFEMFDGQSDIFPFDRIRPGHFAPAVMAGIDSACDNLRKIRNNPAEPDFENTVLALENATEDLDKVLIAFEIMVAIVFDEETMKRISAEISMPVTVFRREMFSDRVLFSRLRTVYEKRDELNLDNQEKCLTECWYEDFREKGAHLGVAQQAKLADINQKLSHLGVVFRHNLVNSKNSFELLIGGREFLKGLPESLIEEAAHRAAKSGRTGGYLLDLSFDTSSQVLEYAENRSLRQAIYEAYNARAFDDNYDNQGVVREIAYWRYKKAQLFGYRTYAEYALRNNVFRTPKKVRTFLENLLAKLKPPAEKEYEELKKFAFERDGLTDFQVWDIGFYAGKMKERKAGLNAGCFRPYFRLENVLEGFFQVAEKLYGIKFSPADVPVWNGEIKTFKARDENGAYLGLVYVSLFASSDAVSFNPWTVTVRGQNENRRPQVLVNFNYSRPVPGKPKLLTLHEVSGFFHEMGHVLHALMSACKFARISNMRTPRDFVEFPSILMEKWSLEREVWDLFAFHCETGEKIPAGFTEPQAPCHALLSLRQLAFILLDVAWHDTDFDSRPYFLMENILAFERDVLKEAVVWPIPDNVCFSCSFDIIFSSDYAASLYTYIWNSFLSDDAFELFKAGGIFNRELADSLRSKVLSKGISAPLLEAYREFRGGSSVTEKLLEETPAPASGGGRNCGEDVLFGDDII